MKALSWQTKPITMGLSLFLISCDRQVEEGFQMSVVQTQEELQREAEFTVWLSRAELQFLNERLLQGDYFSAVEGRLKNGENQYRAISSRLNRKRYSNCVSFWGLTSGELYVQELDHLRKGYEKTQSQVFTDSTGKAIHQLVMLLPKNSSAYESLDPGLLGSADEVEAPTNKKETETVHLAVVDGVGGENEPEAMPEQGGDYSSAVAEKSDVVVRKTESEPPVDWLAGERSLDEVVEEVNAEDVNNVIGIIETPDLPEGGESEVVTEDSAPEIVALEVLDPVGDESDTSKTETAELEWTDPKAAELEPEVPKVMELETEEPEIVEPEPTEPEIAKADSVKPEPEPEPAPAPILKTISYKVVRGDNLTVIARRFKVSIKDIKKTTGIRSDMLRVGQVLKIPNQS